jgi:hypothetical protein
MKLIDRLATSSAYKKTRRMPTNKDNKVKPREALGSLVPMLDRIEPHLQTDKWGQWGTRRPPNYRWNVG